MSTAEVRPTRREIVARLARAQKSNRGAAGYSRWVNRPMGRQIAAATYLAGLSPNQISAISAAFTYTGIACIALFKPAWWLSGLIALLLVIGYAFDSADGQVARLRGGGSTAGEWLDHVLDALKTSTIHVAVAISWFRFYGLSHPSALLIPLGFGAVATVFFFTLMLSDMLRRVARVAAGQSGVATSSVNPNEAAPVLRSLIVLPNDYGLLCLTFILLPAHDAFIAVYTALFALNLLFLLAGFVRWFREMQRL